MFFTQLFISYRLPQVEANKVVVVLLYFLSKNYLYNISLLLQYANIFMDIKYFHGHVTFRVLFPAAIGNRKEDVIRSDNVLRSSVTNIGQ